jgi:hypothetical protein
MGRGFGKSCEEEIEGKAKQRKPAMERELGDEAAGHREDGRARVLERGEQRMKTQEGSAQPWMDLGCSPMGDAGHSRAYAQSTAIRNNSSRATTRWSRGCAQAT